MTALRSKSDLLRRVVSAVKEAGWNASVDRPEHPFGITAAMDGQTLGLLVYIWNLTHGGGEARPAAEHRIQLTGVTPPLERVEGMVTLLLGWDDEHGVFAAFQPDREFSEGSSSVQIDEAALTAAVASGFGFNVKANDEIAVAFRPDLLVRYARMQPSLHDRERADEIRSLGDVARAETLAEVDATVSVPLELPGDLEGTPPAERLTAMVRQTVRDSSFRSRVLAAYEHKCCMCGMSLGFVEAAHIVPVKHEPNFLTKNGLALCPMHHRAYDAGLLTVDEDGRVELDGGRIEALAASDRVAGLEILRANLRSTIAVPEDEWLRPDRRLLAKARQLRSDT